MKGKDINKKYDELEQYLNLCPKAAFFDVQLFVTEIQKYFNLTHSTDILLIGYADDVHCINHELKKYVSSTMEIILEGVDLTTDCESDIYSIEKINPAYEREYDYVFFCSRWHAEYVTQMLLYNSSRRFRVIDIYDWYEYLIGERPVHSITYKEKRINHNKRVNNYDAIYCRRKAFEHAAKYEEKVFFLGLIIEDFFYIRDIVSLNKYIALYIEYNGRNINKYKKLIKKIDRLFEDIKLELNNHEGIIIFWTDAVSHKRAKEFDFLSDVRKDALIFENAYTHIPYTDTTLHTLITGSYYFEDLDPGGSDRTSCESIVQRKDLVPYLEKKGYVIKENLFYLELYHPEISPTIASEYYVGYKYKPSSLQLWDSMMAVLDIQDKIFLICHCSDNETHHPYWHGENGYMDIPGCSPLADESSFEQQKRVAVQYAEKEILFYQSIYPDNCFNKIFMGDHGIGVPAYVEDRIHAMFMIKGFGIKHGIEKRLFSYLKFSDLIRSLIEGDGIKDSIFSEYIIVENQDPYSKRYTEEVFEKFSKSKEYFNLHYPDWAAFRCVMDEKLKVVLFRNGLIKYYKIPDDEEIEESNLNEFYKGKYLSIIGTIFEDLNMPKLVNSKLLYDRFNRIGYLTIN